MIECYYQNCLHHSKEEPFCSLNSCLAAEIDKAKFEVERQEELFEVKLVYPLKEAAISLPRFHLQE